MAERKCAKATTMEFGSIIAVFGCQLPNGHIGPHHTTDVAWVDEEERKRQKARIRKRQREQRHRRGREVSG